jgi:predicted secreted acid phosphatase
VANVQCVTAYDAPAIKPIRSLFRRAKALKVAVFFITARPEVIRSGTLDNLKAAGYTGKYELILEPPGYTIDSKVPYKSGARKKIQKRGYKIIANVGDQQSDLKGGYSERTYKLPNLIYLTP